MSRTCSIMMVAVLTVIAGNMTYSNLKQPAQEQVKQMDEKVLPVIGRLSMTFDGRGVDVGFLVRDGETLKIIRVDKGSMMDNKAFKPKYLTVCTHNDGSTTLDSPTVIPIDN
jgi:hypothetical protein